MKSQPIAIQPVRENAPIKLFTMDDFFDRVRATQARIAHRAYEIFESSGKPCDHDLDHWLKAEAELLHPVHLDVVDSGDGLIVHAEVPGFKAGEIEVNVEPHRLTITGKRQTKDETKAGETLYTERSADQILRVIDLPVEVTTDGVAAALKDGVLELNMPKAAATSRMMVEDRAA